MSVEIPYGYCHCGCGQKTSIAKQSDTKRGYKRGEPVKYLHAHGVKTPRVFIIGERFARLVVKGMEGIHVLCVCDCGKEKKIHRSHLITGHTRSCGCLSRENASARLYKHGNTLSKKNTPTFTCWNNMLNRCSNPNNRVYKHYGGRGITVCDRWHTFANFLTDMGEKPKGLSIERKNNNLGYFPDNCVWATNTEQARNRRNNRLVTIDGRTQILAQWLEELGFNPHTFNSRIRSGMSHEDALQKKIKGRPE